jgi:hypothetical protein
MNIVNPQDSQCARLCSSISAPQAKRDSNNSDGLQTLSNISSPAKIHPEFEDLEDTTLHYAPSGDLTACVSWYNCSSLTVPNIIKVSLLPVVSPRTLAPSYSNIPVSSSLTKPAVVHSLSSSTPESLKHILSRTQNHTSNLTTSISRRTTGAFSTDCALSINLVPTRETKSSINLTEDFEPVLEMSFSTSSIEPRSIVSYGIMGTLGRGTYGKVLLAYLKTRPDGDLYAVKMLRKNETPAGELNTLQMVANAEEIAEDGVHGALFLQRLADHFQNDRFHFIVLVRILMNLVFNEQLIYLMIVGISSYHIIGTRNGLSLPHSRTGSGTLCLNLSAIGW